MKNKQPKTANREQRQSRELLGMISIFLAIVLGLALYLKPGSAGVLGDFVRKICVGLWGPMAYGLPVVPFVSGLIMLTGREHHFPRNRVLHAVFILCILSGFWHLLNYSLDDTRYVLNAMRKSHSTLDQAAPLPASLSFSFFWRGGLEPEAFGIQNQAKPGGVIGGVLASSLEKILGFYGALAIFILLLLVELFMLFNFSLSLFLQSRRQQKAERQSSSSQLQAMIDNTLERSIANNQEANAYLDEPGREEEEGAPKSNLDDSVALTVAEWNEQYREVWMDSEPDEIGDEYVPEEALPEDDFETAQVTEQNLNLHSPAPWFEDWMQSSPESKHDASKQDAATASNTEDDDLGKLPIETYEDKPIVIETNSEAALSHEGDLPEGPEDTDSANDMSSPEVSTAEDEEIPEVETHSSDDSLIESETSADRETEESPDMALASNEESEENEADEASESAKEEKSKDEAEASGEGDQAKQDQSEEEQEGEAETKVTRPYITPPLSLLNYAKKGNTEGTRERVQELAKRLIDTLNSFGVEAKVEHITTGPTITRFEISPGPGVKVSRIVNLSDDIALNLAATGVRIEAPIPGKSAIGIEIPNEEKRMVDLRSLLESQAWRENKRPLVVPLGRDIPGAPIICDLKKMPHLLIAGATGSGKSICINAILMSVLYCSSPKDVRLLMIDPKVVELSVYNGIPHLLAPVVTDPKKAANTLNWAVEEMERRYGLFAQFGVRDAQSYNEFVRKRRTSVRQAKANGNQELLLKYQDEDEKRRKRAEDQNMNVRKSDLFPADEELPYILIVIDELSDLMQTSPKEVEDSIARLTAMARAAGIHLIIATQRPSVDVITGVIKANIPSRISFAVSSQIDSRTILDQSGAEKLLGKGDMLYAPQDKPKPVRGQGAFVSSEEVERVIEFICDQDLETTDPEIAQAIMETSSPSVDIDKDEERDELYEDAVEVLLEAGYASVSILQRRLNIGYPRAARLIDNLELDGLVGPFEGSKPREILIDRAQWEAILSQED